MADDDRKKNIIDEEDAEAQKQRSALPLTWKHGGTNGATVAEQALIEKPTDRQLRVFQNQRVRTCGQCKHFRRGHFQQIKDQFMAALIHDYQWRKEFIGDKPENMGRCMQNDELAVGPNSLGCDAFKAL